MDGQYYNLWSTDNDKTVPNDDVVIKSVYDPSPVGYSLPASNAFTGFTTTGGNVGDWPNPITPEDKAKLNIKGDLDNGWYFYTKPNKQGGTVFFPTCGHRSHNFGSLACLWEDAVGLHVLALRTAVAAWISARATSTNCTSTAIVVMACLFAAQRRR